MFTAGLPAKNIKWAISKFFKKGEDENGQIRNEVKCRLYLYVSQDRINFLEFV